MDRFVMLVDDDAATADMYRLGLEAYGLRVAVAHSAAGLFAAIETGVPDVIVLDWQLRETFGDQVLRQLRLDPRTATTPVFMLSNFPESTDGAVDRVFQAGALAWLEKFKTPPSLLARKIVELLA